MFETVSVEEFMDMARRAGESVARTFPGMDAEDLSSEALTAIMENAWSVKGKDRDYIYKALEAAAERFALKARYDYMLATSTYVYRPAEVRALLKEFYWNQDEWDVPSGPDDRLSASISKDTVFVSVMDIQAAWKTLSSNHIDVLIRVFRDGDESVHSQYVTRAVDALTRALNWQVNRPATDHKGPGARKAMSNSQARHLTGS